MGDSEERQGEQAERAEHPCGHSPLTISIPFLDTVDGDVLPGTSCSGPASGTEVGPSTRKGEDGKRRVR